MPKLLLGNVRHLSLVSCLSVVPLLLDLPSAYMRAYVQTHILRLCCGHYVSTAFRTPQLTSEDSWAAASPAIHSPPSIFLKLEQRLTLPKNAYFLLLCPPVSWNVKDDRWVSVHLTFSRTCLISGCPWSSPSLKLSTASDIQTDCANILFREFIYP